MYVKRKERDVHEQLFHMSIVQNKHFSYITSDIWLRLADQVGTNVDLHLLKLQAIPTQGVQDLYTAQMTTCNYADWRHFYVILNI